MGKQQRLRRHAEPVLYNWVIMKTSEKYSSSGRFAVDREFEYMELVSRSGLEELFGPPGELRGPPPERFGSLGGERTFRQLL